MYIIWRVDHYRSMDREREEIHALLMQTHTQNMKQDNNAQTGNVHNMVSGTLYVGQWIEKGEKYMHFKHKHTQNMKQENNSHTENVHNMASGTLQVNG